CVVLGFLRKGEPVLALILKPRPGDGRENVLGTFPLRGDHLGRSVKLQVEGPVGQIVTPAVCLQAAGIALFGSLTQLGELGVLWGNGLIDGEKARLRSYRANAQ